MKATILTLIFCLGLVIHSFGQVATEESSKTPQELYEFHIQKRRTNNLAGWLTFAGGLTMAIGAGVITYTDGGHHEALAISGGVIALSSIYFFSKASDHKRKAKIQLQNGAVGINKEFKYTGISVSYNF